MVLSDFLIPVATSIAGSIIAVSVISMSVIPVLAITGSDTCVVAIGPPMISLVLACVVTPPTIAIIVAAVIMTQTQRCTPIVVGRVIATPRIGVTVIPIVIQVQSVRVPADTEGRGDSPEKP